MRKSKLIIASLALSETFGRQESFPRNYSQGGTVGRYSLWPCAAGLCNSPQHVSKNGEDSNYFNCFNSPQSSNFAMDKIVILIKFLISVELSTVPSLSLLRLILVGPSNSLDISVEPDPTPPPPSNIVNVIGRSDLRLRLGQQEQKTEDEHRPWTFIIYSPHS